MRTKRLGTSDLELTRVGLGTWAIGGGDWSFAWGPQAEADSIATIHEALDLGVNWIDTAPVYGMGTSEEAVGRALEGMRERPIVATKCGRTWSPDRTIVPRLEADSVREEAEASLRRLRVDVIDLYQIHWPEPDADIEAAWDVLTSLKEQGKIRFGGVSNFSAGQMARLHARAPIASLQPPYSMLRREVEQEVLPWCAEHDVGVIAYSPMAKGLLTGRMDAARIAALPEDDHRRRDPMFLGDRLDAANAVVRTLEDVGARHGIGPAALSVAWVLHRSEVTAAIVGARKPGQLLETTEAAAIDLTPRDLQDIEGALDAYAAAT